MEEEIKMVRGKYMARIRELYVVEKEKEWCSPVKKLKKKNGSGLRS